MYGDQKDLNKKYLRLLMAWRGCLTRLQKDKPIFSADRLSVCWNCMPCGVVVTPDSLVCDCNYLCPFCWGRSAQDVYRNMRSVLCSLPERYKHEYAVTAFRCTKLEKPVGRRLDNFLYSQIRLLARKRLKLMPQLELTGAYTVSSFEPRPDMTWAVTLRGFLVKSGPVVDGDLDKVLGTPCETQLLVDITSRRLAKLTSWCMRYPRYLLSADAGRLGTFLHVRVGQRLASSYGCLRAYRRADEPAEADGVTDA